MTPEELSAAYLNEPKGFWHGDMAEDEKDQGTDNPMSAAIMLEFIRTHAMDRIAAGFFDDMVVWPGFLWFASDARSSSMGYLLVGTSSERFGICMVTSFLFWVSDGMVDSAARGLRRRADVTRAVGCPRRCGYFVAMVSWRFRIFSLSCGGDVVREIWNLHG